MAQDRDNRSGNDPLAVAIINDVLAGRAARLR
jgi:hypothetical protein